MTQGIYCIKDEISGQFYPMNVFVNDQEAIRYFRTIINSDKETLIASNPNDFVLYKMGDWDISTGIQNADVNMIVTGRELKQSV